jgi:hypothetical protein
LLIKKALEVDSSKLDPPIALRMALCSGTPIRSEWLKPATIDLALETKDIVRHFDKLTMGRKVIDAASLAEILGKRAEKSPIPVLHALRKAVIPKRSKRKPTIPTVVDEATALQFVKIVSTLVPQLLQGDLTARKKHIGQELLEVIHAVAKSSREPAFAGKAVEFVRALEKYLGWTDMEKEPLQEMRSSILLLPAQLLPDVLKRGCIVEATDLRQKAALMETSAQSFKAVLKKLAEAGYGQELPQISRNWVHKILNAAQDESVPSNRPISDAGLERLALVLINIWESREEGKNSQHAFSIGEEIFMTGFNLFLMGDVGAVVNFDPDIYESSTVFANGEKCLLARPWVEWRSTEGLRVLLKGRVVPITERKA